MTPDPTEPLTSVGHLGVTEAREIIRRAIVKALELAQTGAFVVVDDGGNVVSISRMDGAGPTSVGVSRAKAYVAAVNRESSARFSGRLARGDPNLFRAYQAILPGTPFPGPGALPIRRNGRVVGAVSTGAGIGPTIKAAGVDPVRFLVDGVPANAEDLIIAHALRIPYEPQHGDDVQRWTDAYGSPPPDPAPAATVSSPDGNECGSWAEGLPRLSDAVAIADRALSRAGELGARIAVAVTDRHGDVVQLDRMDGAPPMTPDVAVAKAATAVNFGRPSGEVAADIAPDTDLARMAAIGGFELLALPGGLPILDGHGAVTGAIGVSSAEGAHDGDIARSAMSR
jgi:uncharacterized protein GlcG (DUF336 family)